MTRRPFALSGLLVLPWAIGCYQTPPRSLETEPPPASSAPGEPSTSLAPAALSATASAEAPPTLPPGETRPPPIPLVVEVVNFPAPGPGWKRVEASPAFGYIAMFFGQGGRQALEAPELQPIAAWKKGEDREISVFRRVDLATGAPLVTGRIPPSHRAKKLADGVLWYETPSDGTQFYWVASGSLVMEAKTRPLASAPSLAAVFRPWALRAARSLATPVSKPAPHQATPP